MTIREFIKKNKQDYDHYRTQGSWNGYTVFQVWAKRNEGGCVGLPIFALEKDGEFRLATLEEIHSIMKEIW